MPVFSDLQWFSCFPSLLLNLHSFLKVCMTCNSSAVPYKSNSAVNTFCTSARISALPFFLVYQRCPRTAHCFLPVTWLNEKEKFLICFPVNSFMTWKRWKCCLWQCELGQHIPELRCSLCSAESTGRSMGQRFRFLLSFLFQWDSTLLL